MIPPAVCPKCGQSQGWWDNAEKKATGSFKPNAPDHTCKNKDCRHGIWKEERIKPAAPAPREVGGWAEVHALLGRAKHEAAKFLGPERAADASLLMQATAVFAQLAQAKGLSPVG